MNWIELLLIEPIRWRGGFRCTVLTIKTINGTKKWFCSLHQGFQTLKFSITKLWSLNTSHSNSIYSAVHKQQQHPTFSAPSSALSLLSVPLACCSVWAIQAKHHRIILHSFRNTHSHTQSLPAQCAGQEDLRSQISGPLALHADAPSVREDAKISEREGRRGGEEERGWLLEEPTCLFSPSCSCSRC